MTNKKTVNPYTNGKYISASIAESVESFESRELS